MSSADARTVAIAADHPAFDGHFPGHPILPGVALLAEVMEAARAEPAWAAALGDAPRIAVVKFLAPVLPGTTVRLDFRLAARTLDWQAGDGERAVASGQFARADLASPAS